MRHTMGYQNGPGCVLAHDDFHVLVGSAGLSINHREHLLWLSVCKLCLDATSRATVFEDETQRTRDDVKHLAQMLVNVPPVTDARYPHPVRCLLWEESVI